MSKLILNADDFGRSREINEAILRAHQEGVLTSASLMVAGDAFHDAVEIARRTPTLAVGLHVVAVAGKAVLPPQRIPHLAAADESLPDAPVRLGLHYAFSPTARRELAEELAAQFARFAATGLPFSHVDGHLHMHLHPVVFRLLLPLVEQYKVPGIRLPRDDRLWLALRRDPSHPGGKIARSAIFRLLSRWCGRQLPGRQLAVPDRAYGLAQTGQMNEAYVVALLDHITVPSAEIYFHPTVGRRIEALGPNPDDFQTLISPAVRQVIERRSLRLATYRTLSEN